MLNFLFLEHVEEAFHFLGRQETDCYGRHVLYPTTWVDDDLGILVAGNSDLFLLFLECIAALQRHFRRDLMGKSRLLSMGMVTEIL